MPKLPSHFHSSSGVHYRDSIPRDFIFFLLFKKIFFSVLRYYLLEFAFVEGLFFLFFFFSFCLFRATPVAYGSSQARGPIGVADAGLHHSHSNLGSKLHVRPIAQLTAMPDPSPTE